MAKQGVGVVAHHHDGASYVQFIEQFIETGLGALVDVGPWFIQYEHFRIGDYGTA